MNGPGNLSRTKQRALSVGGMGDDGEGPIVPWGDCAVSRGWDFVAEIDCEAFHKISQPAARRITGVVFVSAEQTGSHRPTEATMPG
jgi:hypothetical protein